MKRNIFLVIIFASFFEMQSAAQRASIAVVRENTVYMGIDNPITIAVENYPCNSIIAKVDNGALEGGKWYYSYRPKNVGHATITLYTKISGKLKEINRSDFMVKEIWDPIFKIGSGRDSVSRKEIQSQSYVRADLEGSDMSCRFTIESFIVCIVSKDTCKYVEILNQGNTVGKEIKKVFGELSINDTIIFKEIFCVGPDGKKEGSHQ